MSTPLIDIAMMNFDELSRFVKTATNGDKYIAKPAEASIIDCDICAEAIINIVIMPALKNEHKRADSRSLKVGDNDHQTALQLASAARTYWVDRGFIISTNARVTRALSSQIIDQQKAQAKTDMVALQLETIGGILGVQKAHKKGGLQSFIDWDETELVAQKIENEGEMMPASYFNTLAIA